MDLLPVTTSGSYTLKPVNRLYLDPDAQPALTIHPPVANADARALDDAKLVRLAESTIGAAYRAQATGTIRGEASDRREFPSQTNDAGLANRGRLGTDGKRRQGQQAGGGQPHRQGGDEPFELESAFANRDAVQLKLVGYAREYGEVSLHL